MNPLSGKSRATVAAAAVALLLAACGSSSGKDPGGRGGRGGLQGPVKVGYVIVQQGSAPLEQERDQLLVLA